MQNKLYKRFTLYNHLCAHRPSSSTRSLPKHAKEFDNCDLDKERSDVVCTRLHTATKNFS